MPVLDVSIALQDFGAGTSYSRYTAAYLDNREDGGEGVLTKTQPMKPDIIETGTNNILVFKVGGGERTFD